MARSPRAKPWPPRASNLTDAEVAIEPILHLSPPANLALTAPDAAAVQQHIATLADVPADAHIAADTTTPEGAAAAFAACREQLGAAPSWLAYARWQHLDCAAGSHR